MKNIFVILGVARSGTSAIARSLKALGIELGDNMSPASDKWNSKGFWEDTDIVYKINGRAFSALDFAAYGIQQLDKTLQTSDKLSEIKQSAITLLQERFASTDHWGFKDPSTVKLLTFWQSIFTELHIQDNYIIALRNPLASAQSYKNVTGSELEIGLLLWLMHLVPAIEETTGKNRVVVSYDLLLQDPHLQLDRIKRDLNITLPVSSDEVNAYTEHFLDKKLHRHEYSTDDLKSHAATAVVPLCLRVYDLLMKLAKDELSFQDEQFATQWQEIQAELQKIYPVYCYVDTLLKEMNHLKKSLRSIHKSAFWKLLYPLRMIDDRLRTHRQKSRMNKRLIKAYS
jgi:hypothetical protein